MVEVVHLGRNKSSSRRGMWWGWWEGQEGSHTYTPPEFGKGKEAATKGRANGKVFLLFHMRLGFFKKTDIYYTKAGIQAQKGTIGKEGEGREVKPMLFMPS